MRGSAHGAATGAGACAAGRYHGAPAARWRRAATIRFTIAALLTAAYVALGVYVSAPWRSDLREAIGPVMAWVIPIMLAYIPGVLIGFLMFTLLTLRYRVPSADAPHGPWPAGEWLAVTVLVAAWNEEQAIGQPSTGSRSSPTPAPSTSSWPTTTRRTARPR